jgi:hypothetical protein
MMQKGKTKVCVAIPSNRVKHYCLGKFIKGLKNMEEVGEVIIADDTRPDDTALGVLRGHPDTNSEGHAKVIKELGYNVERVTATLEAKEKPPIRQRLVNTREHLRNYFLKTDCTHIFYLDSDIIAPKYTIPELLRHKMDIVTGVYFQRDKDNQARPVIYRNLDQESTEVGATEYTMPLSIDDLIPSRLIGDADSGIQILSHGTGCLLISRKIMEDPNWKFRYDVRTPATEDTWFCIDMRKMGHTLYCDTGVIAKHYPKAWEGPV